jgi:hypothetical protein
MGYWYSIFISVVLLCKLHSLHLGFNVLLDVSQSLSNSQCSGIGIGVLCWAFQVIILGRTETVIGEEW